MNETALTREKILEAAENVLRRYGLSKATVVDVARMLGVSHGSVYRHFASKAELREAVLRVWLSRVHDSLEIIAGERTEASERLTCWLEELIAIKRRRLFDDPELFAAYGELGKEAGEAIREHLAHMTDQLRRIVVDGVAQGEFTSEDPEATARAVLNATSRFHHPAHVAEWSKPHIDRDFREVLSLILQGAQGRASGGRGRAGKTRLPHATEFLSLRGY